MKKLHFDVRDIFATPRLALSGKKIWVQFLGLAIGWAVYTVLTYLGLILNGQSLVEIWRTHHLFPCLWNVALPIAWYAWLLSILGLVIWVILFLLASTAVARITYKQLKGDEFFSSGDSFKYLKKHGVAVIMGPVSIVLIMLFFIVCAIIAAWIAKWPVLDIIFLGLPYLLYFVVSTFVVYTAVVFVVCLLIAPAIVGTAEEDTMETVFQSYSTLWAQPWRLVIYEALVGVLSLVATFVYGWALILGYKFFNLVFGQSWLMGDKMTKIAEKAISYIYGVNSPITPFIDRFFQTCKLPTDTLPCLSTTEYITAVLLGIALLVIGGSVVAYLLTNFSAGQALIYIILRKKKDDENLIERKDEDELKEEEERKKEEESKQTEPEKTEPTTESTPSEPSTDTPTA